MIALKMRKILKIVSIVLAVLVLLLVVLVFFWLGPTAKALVERIGPKVLGTPVTIEYLSINPRKGSIDLRGFQIGSHEGFSRTNTWELADFHVAIDMRSLFSDTIIIHEIQIDAPHFIYEQNQTTDTISEFIRNIQRFADIDPNEPKPEKPPKDDSGKAPKKVIIETLEINDIQIHLAYTDDSDLDVQLGLEQLSLSLTSGVVQLNHLLLSDPGLLSIPNVAEIEAVIIKLDPDSIYSDRIVIEDVQVIRPYAFLENNADTDTVSEFMRLAQTFIDKLVETEPDLVLPALSEEEPEVKAAATSLEPPPFELWNLYVDDIQLKLLDTTRTNAKPEVQTLAAIGGISIKLAEGRIHIQELTIPNPGANYLTTNLLHLARIDISIKPESLFSEQIVIHEVFVDSPRIDLEQTDAIGNIAELQNILEVFIPPVLETASSEPATSTKGERIEEPISLAEQPVVLETLIVTNLAIHMTSPPETNAPASGMLKHLKPKDWFAGEETNATIALLAFEHLSVEPLKGLIQIINLHVGNPPGFAHDNLATIDLLRIEIDPDSIQTDTLLIEDILIDTPNIAYERQLSTDNIKTLQASVEAAMVKRADTLENPEAKPEPAPTSEATAEQKVIIGHLLVQHGKVKAKLSALPSAPIPLPAIERRDMGKEEGGVSMTDTLSTLGTLFYDAILGAVSSLTGFAGDALKGVGSFTTGTLSAATGDIFTGDSTTEEQAVSVASEEAPPEEKETKKKRRSFGGRRRPGRPF